MRPTCAAIALFVFGNALAIPAAFGQHRVPIAVEDTSEADDIVGQTLAFETKEALRRSTQFMVVESGVRMALVLRTIDAMKAGLPHAVSAIGATWVMYTEDSTVHYLMSEVGVVGFQMTKPYAENLVAETDKLLGVMRKKLYHIP